MQAGGLEGPAVQRREGRVLSDQHRLCAGPIRRYSGAHALKSAHMLAFMRLMLQNANIEQHYQVDNMGWKFAVCRYRSLHAETGVPHLAAHI